MEHQEGKKRNVAGDITNTLFSILESCSLGKRVRKLPSKFKDHLMGNEVDEEVIPKKRSRGRTVAFKMNINEDDMIQDENNNAGLLSQTFPGRSRRRTVKNANDENGLQIAAPSSRQRTVLNPLPVDDGQNRNRTRTVRILKQEDMELVEAEPSRPTRTRTTKSLPKEVPTSRSRTVCDPPTLDQKRKRTRTVKVVENEEMQAIKLLPQDESSRPTRRRTRARTTKLSSPKDETKNGSRSRTRQRTTKAQLQGIVFDCKIEGVDQTFDVSRKMLSEKSHGFKTLFEANNDDLIELEGIPDKTLEVSFRYLHGYALSQCSYEDTFSVLFFADVWEIPDLKSEIEERLLAKLLPSNVVKICNRTFSMSDALQTACKEFMLEKHSNGQKIANFNILMPQIQTELNQSLIGSQRIRCRTVAA